MPKIKEADRYYTHFGFRMKPGFLFGKTTINGLYVDFVYTGKTRPAKLPNGSVYGKEVMIFTRLHKSCLEADQRNFDYDWAPIWINCGGGSIGKKILARSVNHKFKAIPEYKPTTPAPGRHLFNTSCRQLG